MAYFDERYVSRSGRLAQPKRLSMPMTNPGRMGGMRANKIGSPRARRPQTAASRAHNVMASRSKAAQLQHQQDRIDAGLEISPFLAQPAPFQDLSGMGNASGYPIAPQTLLARPGGPPMRTTTLPATTGGPPLQAAPMAGGGYGDPSRMLYDYPHNILAGTELRSPEEIAAFQAETDRMMEEAIEGGRRDARMANPELYGVQSRQAAREANQAMMDRLAAQAAETRSGRPGWRNRGASPASRPQTFGGVPAAEGREVTEGPFNQPAVRPLTGYTDAGIAGNRVMPTYGMTPEETAYLQDDLRRRQRRIDRNPEMQARMDAAEQKRADFLGESTAKADAVAEQMGIPQGMTEREQELWFRDQARLAREKFKGDNRLARIEQRRWMNMPRPITAMDRLIARNPEAAIEMARLNQQGALAQAQMAQQERLAMGGMGLAREQMESKERMGQQAIASEKEIAEINASSAEGVAKLEGETRKAIADTGAQSAEKVATINAKVQEEIARLQSKAEKGKLKQSDQQHLERMLVLQTQLEEARNAREAARAAQDLARDESDYTRRRDIEDLASQQIQAEEQRRGNPLTEEEKQGIRDKVAGRMGQAPAGGVAGPARPQTVPPRFEPKPWMLDENGNVLPPHELRDAAKEHVPDPDERERLLEQLAGVPSAGDLDPLGVQPFQWRNFLGPFGFGANIIGGMREGYEDDGLLGAYLGGWAGSPLGRMGRRAWDILRTM